MSPRFAVVITNYNYRSFVCGAVDSALQQRHPAGVVVVVDDGSSDGSIDELTKRYGDNRQVVLLSGQNRGQLGAAIRGIDAVEAADYLCFLDADDLWQPEYLAELALLIEKQPDLDFIYSNMRFFGDREGIYCADPVSRDLGISVLLGAFHTQFQATATSALCLRFSLARQCAALPEDLIARGSRRLDMPFVVGADILGARKFYQAKPLVGYRSHGNNSWLGKRRPAAQALREWLYTDAIALFHRQQQRIDTPSLLHLKHEFRSKPYPFWHELRWYLHLTSLAPLGWGRRMALRAQLLRHWISTLLRRRH